MFIADLELYAAWEKLLRALLNRGTSTSPRDLSTKEILGVSFRVHNGRNNILYHPVRNLNYKFMVAEWLWICSGSDNLDEIARYNSEIRKFSDDGVILYGAYGPRLKGQVDWVIRKLTKDKVSRQAVATIWRPLEEESKDIPCTVSLQFLWRENKMNLVVTMRSSDAWLGLPYDFFVFSQMLNSVCGFHGCEVGFVQFNLGSSHLYDVNLEAAQRIVNEGASGYTHVSPKLPGRPPESLYELFREPVPHRHLIRTLEQAWQTYADILVSGRHDAISILTS